MAKITKITYKCDCCGRESEHEDFNDGQECGNGKLNIYGNVGGLMYDGSWGEKIQVFCEQLESKGAR